MNITSFATASEVAGYVASQVADIIRQNPQATLIVAGGSTYQEAYKLLTELPLTWSEVSIFLSDERMVPYDDERSNYGMIKKLLLDKLPEDNRPIVHRVETELPPEGAAQRYATTLPEKFNVALLGIGSDGHTASLFPSILLTPDLKKVAVTEAGLAPFVQRISLNFTVLNQAERIIIAATGEGKAEIIEKYLKDERRQYPVSWLNQELVEIVVDRAARAGAF